MTESDHGDLSRPPASAEPAEPDDFQDGDIGASAGIEHNMADISLNSGHEPEPDMGGDISSHAQLGGAIEVPLSPAGAAGFGNGVYGGGNEVADYGSGDIGEQVEISLDDEDDGDIGRPARTPITPPQPTQALPEVNEPVIKATDPGASAAPYPNDDAVNSPPPASLSPALQSPSPRHTPPALHSPRIPTPLSPRPLTSPRPHSPSPSAMGYEDIYRPGEIPHYPRVLPAAVDLHSEQNEDDEVDPNAPFESIPLESTPPPGIPAALPQSPSGETVGVPLPPRSPGLGQPSSPTPSSSKRLSWGGFGMTKDGERVANGVLPVHSGAVEAEQQDQYHEQEPVETLASPTPGNDESATGTSTPARRQAPPAHPHPFPIPATPEAAKRNSITSVSSPPMPSSSSIIGSPGPSHTAALGTRGISMLDKVISQTRPPHLPPKDKVEDEIHLHQWEEMMSQSREAEKERRKHQEARRVEREKRLAITTPKWEAMLAASDFSSAKIKGDPELRKLWLEGVPSHLRGKAWAVAIGNPLAMSKDAYKSYASRARKALDSGRFPGEVLDRIEHDLDETLMTLHIFGNGSPVREDLKELLCAWMVYRSDDGLGYAPYINLIGAMFILVSPPPVAFLSMANLLSRPCLRAFFTETQDEIDAFYRVFENLQADTFPKIFANCKNLGLKLPESYFRSLLVEQVPFDAVCRLWDQIMLDGDGFIFRAALAIFGFLEPRLYYPDREEILSVLEGRNPATMAIAERERERAKLRGERYEDAMDGKLSVFGLHEKALFDWLENDGWKESRFERLVVREMPD